MSVARTSAEDVGVACEEPLPYPPGSRDLQEWWQQASAGEPRPGHNLGEWRGQSLGETATTVGMNL